MAPARQEQPAGAPPARLRLRFFARVLDVLLLVAAGFVVLLVLTAAGLLTAGRDTVGAGGESGESVVVGLVTAVVWMGYFVLFESTRGRTPGKMVLGLRVVSGPGGRPTPAASVTRNAFLLIGLATVVPYVGALAGFVQLAAAFAIAVTVVRDPGNRGWHDKLAGTQVLKVA